MNIYCLFKIIIIYLVIKLKLEMLVAQIWNIYKIFLLIFYSFLFYIFGFHFKFDVLVYVCKKKLNTVITFFIGVILEHQVKINENEILKTFLTFELITIFSQRVLGLLATIRILVW